MADATCRICKINFPKNVSQRHGEINYYKTNNIEASLVVCSAVKAHRWQIDHSRSREILDYRL